MAVNIAKLSDEEIKDLLDNKVKNLADWGALHILEELNRRSQTRLTRWMIAATITTALATIAIAVYTAVLAGSIAF